MLNLVCLDRDGTINKDENYYLGSSLRWREQVAFLEGVIEGIKRMNQLPSIKVFVVTNQSGVALYDCEFKNLTEDRMHEVNRHVLKELAKQGAVLEGYVACPYVDSEYAKKARAKGRELDIKYIIDNHPDIKPKIGMLEQCATKIRYKLSEVNLFTVGDRYSDVELGINGGGHGILIASPKTIELGDVAKVQILATKHAGKVFIADNFLEAIDYIEKNLK